MKYKKHIETPIGTLTLIASEHHICEINFTKSESNHIPLRDKHKIFEQCEQELNEYFSGHRKTFSVPLDVRGTDFQKKAWAALLQIPYGKTKSYKSQATFIKKTKAVRAVGAANGKNPIPIIIPCHRVIASDNRLHGYGGGLRIKQKLLEIEGCTIQNFRLIQN